MRRFAAVAHLDADFAPYSIKIGRSIVPCIVTDRRVLSFVTPQLPPGSTPVQVMCTTAQGSVRRYGRAVWIESKPLRGTALAVAAHHHHHHHQSLLGASSGALFAVQNGAGAGGQSDSQLLSASAGSIPTTSPPYERLTRHAVNQLTPEVPLPSGSTLRDPSETGRTSMVDSTLGGKSEEGDTTDTESNAAASAVAAGNMRVPLTREMLDMFAGRIARRAGSDTASEAVTSTILTLARHDASTGAPPDTVSEVSQAEERTVGTATVGAADDEGGEPGDAEIRQDTEQDAGTDC